jgi:hypothetical protein
VEVKTEEGVAGCVTAMSSSVPLSSNTEELIENSCEAVTRVSIEEIAMDKGAGQDEDQNKDQKHEKGRLERIRHRECRH